MMGMDGGRRIFEKEVIKPKNLSATIGRFWYYFKNYWYALLFVGLLIGISTWAQVTTPKLLGQAVDCYLFDASALAGFQMMAGDADIQVDDNCWYTDDDAGAIEARILADDSIAEEDKQNEISLAKVGGIGQIVLTLLLIYAIAAVAQGLSFFVMSWTGQNALRKMRQELFAHMNRLSVGYYTRNEAGDVMSRITNDTDTIQQVFSFALLNVVSGSVLIVTIIWEMLNANLVYALLSLTIVPFMVIATTYFSNQARKAFRISRQEMGSVNADLQESINGAREVQAFNREDETIEQFRQSNAANRDANIRAATFTAALNPILEALGFVALAIVVVVGGISALQNQPLLGVGSVVSLGMVITFLSFVQRFSQPIQRIAVLWTNIQSAIAGGERIFGLLDEEVEITSKPEAKSMPSIQGDVHFENVWAEYKKGEPVLKGINFEAKQGEVVAIVGPTGAGKTTIINLLPRFYDVTDGSITIDGHDVRDVDVASLRSQIGIVLQDTFLFSDTVMNNIRYGKLDATDEEVKEAAKLVAADAFIERLPKGYDTVLGERGSGLSQGQRQLIAIARTALLNPNILILDEATSSVDTRTERTIQKAFEKLLQGRTSFVIAHRLSTIRSADMVMMVKDGEIIERGTHDSLLEKGGAYHDLYMSQFRYEGQPEETA